MKLNVTIKVINPVVEGVSASTGNPWQRQDIVLAWNEVYTPDGRTREQHLVATLNTAGIAKFAQLECKVGDEIVADLDFDTRCFNGRVVNCVGLKM